MASWISSPMVVRIAFPMMRLAVSPMPIGLTPGHLSRAINRQATNADRLFGFTKEQHILLAVDAKASQRPLEADWKDVHRRFHATASRPEGPAVLSIFKTVLRIIRLSSWLNRMKCDGS